jgi:hypothetical protein
MMIICRNMLMIAESQNAKAKKEVEFCIPHATLEQNQHFYLYTSPNLSYCSIELRLSTALSFLNATPWAVIDALCCSQTARCRWTCASTPLFCVIVA